MARRYRIRDGELHPAKHWRVEDGLLVPARDRGRLVVPNPDPDPDPDPPPPGPGPGGGTPDPKLWGTSPILVEEFQGSSIDTSLWTPRTGSVSNNRATYRPQNLVVTGGQLQVRNQLISLANRSYYSGDMQAYGPNKWLTPKTWWRGEVIAKIPWEMGLWCAPLWWRCPARGGLEIDQLETYPGHQLQAQGAQVTGALHYKPYGTGHAVQVRKKPYKDLKKPDRFAWHSYVTERTPGMTRMLIDGEEWGRWTPANTPEYAAWFDVRNDRWSPRICVQVDATNTSVASGRPTAGNDWSLEASTMFVDSIRVWDYQE